MVPLSNAAYWRRVIEQKALGAIRSEDLMWSAQTRVASTDAEIFAAVYAELIVRARRAALEWTYPGHHTRDMLVEWVVGRVKEAIRTANKASVQVTRYAHHLSTHFETTIKSWLASEYAKLKRREGLQRSYVVGLTPDMDLDASRRAMDLQVDFRKVYDRMNDRTRRAVTLRAEGLTNEQVGLVMGVGEASVRRWLDASGLRELLLA